MHRRQFLHLTATGTLACALPLACTPPTPPLDQPGLLAFLSEQEVYAIGLAYRQDHPDEDDADLLTRLITTATEATSTALPQHIQDEFSKGETVRIGGWVLARTEARQCALLSFRDA